MELLAALSIISLLSMMVVPALTNLAVGGKTQQALIDVSGAFEKAREFAVAKNTFVYVGFSAPINGNTSIVGIFGAVDSSNGGVTNLNKPETFDVGDVGNLAAYPMVMLDRPIRLEQTSLQDEIPSGNALNNDSRLGASPSFLSQGGVTFRYRSGTADQIVFERLIQFTPDGEARVAPFTPETVRLVMVPMKGDRTPNDAAASVVEISGLTGQIAVRRAGAL